MDALTVVLANISDVLYCPQDVVCSEVVLIIFISSSKMVVQINIGHLTLGPGSKRFRAWGSYLFILV